VSRSDPEMLGEPSRRRSGRSHEAFGNERPRGMVIATSSASQGWDRTRLTGRLASFQQWMVPRIKSGKVYFSGEKGVDSRFGSCPSKTIDYLRRLCGRHAFSRPSADDQGLKRRSTIGVAILRGKVRAIPWGRPFLFAS
jgi:hypothetical protein